MKDKDDLIVFIKLKHGSPFGDPVSYVNSLPDEIIDIFYNTHEYSIEKKRSLAIGFYSRNQDDAALLNEEYNTTLNSLIEYYAGKQ